MIINFLYNFPYYYKFHSVARCSLMRLHTIVQAGLTLTMNFYLLAYSFSVDLV